MAGNAPWYATSFRRNLVDMHIDDWDDSFLSCFDPQKYVECLKTARIKSPMLYLHSHVGLCNWNSESGVTHKAFAGQNKMLELVNLCHGAGMDVIGYYSLIYNNAEYARHPEWRMADSNGAYSRKEERLGFMSGGRYGLLCPNSAEYREFLLRQFAEFLNIYPLEGLFLDMTFWPRICYCANCKKRYMEETGREIPAQVNWDAPAWLLFQEKREEWMTEFALFCSGAVKAIKPDIAIEHQFSTAHQNWRYGVTAGVGDAGDYAGGDLYGGHAQQSLICKLYYEITKNHPFEYMTSRCEPSLAVHTTTKSVNALRLHNCITLAHHGATLFIDAIDPDGGLDENVYRDIGTAFSQSMPYEPFIKGEMLSDVALYFSMTSKYNAWAQQPSSDITVPQLDAVFGASTALHEACILHTVIPDARKEKLLSKKAVAVCGATHMSVEEIALLTEYAKNGGNVYISGSTDARLAEALLGIKTVGRTKERVTYIAPTEAGSPLFGGRYCKKIPLAYQGMQVLAENPNGHDVLATITLPYTNPDDTERFASIHSNPPGTATEHPALVYGKCGKGLVVWSAASFEWNPQKSHKEIWRNVFGLLLCDVTRVEGDIPKGVQFTVFCDGESLLLHAIDMRDPDGSVSLPPFSVRLCAPGRLALVSEVCVLPDGRPIPFEFDSQNESVGFTIANMDMFAMIRIR